MNDKLAITLLVSILLSSVCNASELDDAKAAEVKEVEAKATKAKTAEEKAASYATCVKNKSPNAMGSKFGKLSAGFGETSLITTEMLKAYSAWSTDPGGFPSWPKSIGIKITGSIPAATTTLDKYANAALLLRDGALANGYVSLLGSPNWFVEDCIEFTDEDTNKYWKRDFEPDRVYMSKHPVPPLLRPYFTHGLGAKMFKKSLEEDKELGTGVFGFFGFGFNGPIWAANEAAKKHTASGTLDFQVAFSALRTTKSTLSQLYGEKSDDNEWVYSWEIRASLVAGDNVSILLDYSAPLFSTKDFAENVTLLSLAYATE